ncbi:MAG TPA: DUF6318 family protein [Dermatophilaceae bacterium]|nr:DUF6318 family protein [Dermatophilaceae bacterium]
MTGRGKIAAAVSAAALVASGLAGCGSGTPVGDPSAPGSATSPSPTTPPSSTTTSPSTTSTTPASIPTVPLAARAHTKAGAEAFVRFYFDEVNKAWMQPSVRNLAAYGAPTCKSCKAHREIAATLVAQKRRYDGPPSSILRANALATIDTHTYAVSFALVQEARHVVGVETRKVLEVVPRRVLTYEATVQMKGDSWIIRAIKASV